MIKTSAILLFLNYCLGKKVDMSNHGKTKRATLQKRNVNLANKNEM